MFNQETLDYLKSEASRLGKNNYELQQRLSALERKLEVTYVKEQQPVEREYHRDATKEEKESNKNRDKNGCGFFASCF